MAAAPGSSARRVFKMVHDPKRLFEIRRQHLRPALAIGLPVVISIALFTVLFLWVKSGPKAVAPVADDDRKTVQRPGDRAPSLMERKPRRSGEGSFGGIDAKNRPQRGARPAPEGKPAEPSIAIQAAEKMLAEVMLALDDPDEEMRLEALEKLERLAELKTPSMNPPLQKALGDQSPEVREKAVDVMGEIRSPEILPSLATAFAVGDDEMREDVLDILEDIPDPRAVELIIESGMRDSSEGIREAARASLEWLTEMEFASYEEARAWWSANRDSFRF